MATRKQTLRTQVGTDFGRKPYYTGDYRDVMTSTTDKQIENQKKQKHSEFKKPYIPDYDYSDMEHYYEAPGSDVVELDLPSQEATEPTEQGSSPETVECRCMTDGCYCPGTTTSIPFTCYGSQVKDARVKPTGTTGDQAPGTMTGIKKGKSGTISITAGSSATGNMTYNISLGSPCGQTELVVPQCDDADCCNCTGATIAYTTNTMSTSGSQTLSASGASSSCNITWAISSGGGSLSANEGSSTDYTAPANNAECANNPTIVMYCNGTQMDSLKIGVNGYEGGEAASASGTDGGCPAANPSVRICHGTKNGCDGSVLDPNFYFNGCSQFNQADCIALCPPPSCTVDYRTAGMITAACCPGIFA